MTGRQFGKLLSDIWRDDDWRSLSVDAQWLYEFLISQPNLSTAGVLPLQIAKWARCARGMTVKRINAAIKELAERNYIVVDVDTEEVLVRTFIRHDVVLAGSGKIMLSALRCANVVQSELLRKVLLAEIRHLERDWTPNQTDLINRLDKSLSIGFQLPFDSHSIASVEVEVVVGGEVGANAPTSTDEKLIKFPSSQEQLSNSGTSPARAPARGTRLPEGWKPPDDVVRAIHAELPTLDLRAAHVKFCDYWHAKAGANATKLDWAATWRNWMRTANERGENQLTHNGHPIGRVSEKAQGWEALRTAPEDRSPIPRKELG